MPLERVLLIKSLRFTPCVAKRIKLSNGCKPRLTIATPECSGFRQIRCYAACAMIPDTRTWSPNSVCPRHERKAFVVGRAEAAQRVQSCRGVHRGRVGAFTGYRAGISNF